jgi:hypothetical protein
MEAEMVTGRRFHTGRHGALSCAAVAGVLLFSGLSLAADSFLRGDANGDGVVSLADVYYVSAHWMDGLPCDDAGDLDDSGRVFHNDPVFLFSYLFEDGLPPDAPFPEVGPDPTPDSFPPCSYGGRSPAVDPAAKLEVLDAVAVGGEEVHATIILTLSHSLEIAGYSGRVRIGSEIVDDTIYTSRTEGVEDLVGTSSTDMKGTRVREGVLECGNVDTDFSALPPGDSPILRVTVCLKAGTRAGVYPLTFEAGELIKGGIHIDENGNWSVDEDTGYAIHPTLVSGTLTVLSDVQAGNCQIAAPEGILEASFTLGGAAGGVGGDVEVPLSIRANRACQGFGYAITFDPTILELTSIEKRYPVVPPILEKLGTEEAAQGIARGSVVSLTRGLVGGFQLAPNVEHEVVIFHFLVKEERSTEVSFLQEEVPPTWWDYGNFYLSHGAYRPGDLDASFVFTDAALTVLPDNILFIRGDSNGDDTLDLSDAQNTLNHLFLGGRRPRCHDAADANDDGTIDVSDAIATLDFLFLGRASFSAPFPALGKDPTPDSLPNPVGCYRAL